MSAFFSKEEKPAEIKLTGIIKLQQTPGRTDAWVTQQLTHDYFLAVEITSVNEQSVTSYQTALETLSPMFPELNFDDRVLNDTLSAVSLPPNAKDALHITLGNFGDFRKSRDTAHELDEVVVKRARSLDGKEVELSLSAQDFCLVTSCQKADKLRFGKQSITTASSVGWGRDTIVNLQPRDEIQQKLGALAQQVFGEEFTLWNARKQTVPYHVTLAQANLTPVLEQQTAPSI